MLSLMLNCMFPMMFGLLNLHMKSQPCMMPKSGIKVSVVVGGVVVVQSHNRFKPSKPQLWLNWVELMM